MANFGNDLWGNQKGEGHQAANAYNTLQRAEDEWRRVIWLILWEAKWVVIGKFNLGEKTEDSKIVRKILQSLPESFHAKVTTIEESKDLEEIKV